MPHNTKNDDDRRGSKATPFIILVMFKVPIYIKLQKTRKNVLISGKTIFKRVKEKKPQKGYVGNFFYLKISKQIRKGEKWKQRIEG